MEKAYSFFLSILLQLYFLEGHIFKSINTDQSALFALKTSFTLNTSHPLTQNWSSQASVCDWIGVTCGSLHRRVTALNVSNMNIHGTIPQQLGNLSFLVSLDMSNNNLHGKLSQDLSRLRRLKVMDLAYNNFIGTIPPEIVYLERLELLDLGENNLQGTIPAKIGNLGNLQQLQLDHNYIVGSIPHTISNLSSLWKLNFNTNNLTGAIPTEIGKLHKLEILALQRNKLSGSIPEGLFNISTLKGMSLAYNDLSGSLPSASNCWRTNLQFLYLLVNNIGGIIPSSISNSSNLNELYLSDNKFIGSIPTSLGDLRQLEILDLSDNNLLSPHLSIFASLANCRSLRIVALYNNPLNGGLTDSIGNLSTSLEQFYLYGSEIRGKIPLGIGNLSNLNTLSLFGNDLTGSVPRTLCDLQNLQVFALQKNRLSGHLLECLCRLSELGGVDLSYNQISGPIPYCIGNVTSLRYLYLNSNRIVTNIPMSLWSLKYLLELSLSNNSLVGSLPLDFGNLKVITAIDLSRNKLSGNIPATAGDLQNLLYLSLAYNELQGSIPESLGKMIGLETLDLSNNILSGVIPKSLEALIYLKDFNVSFNRLEGEIPSKGPFFIFTSQSFIGNEELCGGSLFLPCEAIHQSRRSKVLLIILVTLAISLMTLGSIVVFMLKRRWNRNVPTQVESLPATITPARVSYIEIERATQGFNQCNLLGSGGFGSVYRDRFADGVVLAIKVFSLQFEGALLSFDRECEILRNLRHRNLNKVISSCSNMDFKALLLEYMPNGSLEKWLYSDNFFLDIIQRLDVMIDVASALEYFHYGYSTVVVHCDLKPSNVLLDERLVGHVSDFGLAKLLGEGVAIAHTKTLATMGYIAPEYGSAGLVSTSCDVYSYGIMLMETFTRKRPQDDMFQENFSMRSWVCISLASAVEDIVDSTLLEPEETRFNKILHCATSILELALNCTFESPNERLNIKDVLANIKKIKLEFLCK